MAVGTPHYMSPEQGIGGDHVDGRSDLYSLACVTYEMLVGQPPFQGPNAMAILARHSMEAVPSLKVVRHSIPDEVEDAVMRALEKTPADRFPTVRDFAEALCQADLGPSARRTSSRAMQAVRRPPPARRQPRRKGSGGRGARFWAVSLAAPGGSHRYRVGRLASMAPGGLNCRRGYGGLDPHRIAVLYFQEDGGGDSLRYLADGLTEGLIGSLDRVQGLDVISKGGVAPYRGDSIPRQRRPRAPGGNPGDRRNRARGAGGCGRPCDWWTGPAGRTSEASQLRAAGREPAGGAGHPDPEGGGADP